MSVKYEGNYISEIDWCFSEIIALWPRKIYFLDARLINFNNGEKAVYSSSISHYWSNLDDQIPLMYKDESEMRKELLLQCNFLLSHSISIMINNLSSNKIYDFFIEEIDLDSLKNNFLMRDISEID
ncbi:hypothetical protein K4H28_02330 [Deefgea tanakiae]|uniref:Uncharacterized protein n=1 Tax=Deefgea tanakiae TaxID=2865840 RepID=A0ABX8Z6R7_9NEIS|nr:hypothetical protein [Deefgea tanakiae]QZA78276.1 hypothetical protein K4H28_02330 [Deefgea tanakiae]